MNKAILIVLSISITGLSASCSEEPATVVEPKIREQKNEETSLKALIYKGKIFKTNKKGDKLIPSVFPCTMQISLIEEDHGHHMVGQLVETLHGVKMAAMELDPYYLDETTEVYSEQKTVNSLPSLVGILRSGDNKEKDPNAIISYEEDTKDLLQSVEMFFSKEMNFESLEAILEDVIENNKSTLSAKQKTQIDILSGMSVRFFHASANHYEPPMTCGLLKLDSVQEAEFNMDSAKEKTGHEHGEENHEHDDHSHHKHEGHNH